MREDLDHGIVIDALSMALASRRPAPGLIHHSDQGSQYTSPWFGKALSESGLLGSMDWTGSGQRADRELLCDPEVQTDPGTWVPDQERGPDGDLLDTSRGSTTAPGATRRWAI